jgi:hypothetical protein
MRSWQPTNDAHVLVPRRVRPNCRLNLPRGGEHVRVTTAFNTMLQITGASVTTVEFIRCGRRPEAQAPEAHLHPLGPWPRGHVLGTGPPGHHQLRCDDCLRAPGILVEVSTGLTPMLGSSVTAATGVPSVLISRCRPATRSVRLWQPIVCLLRW